MDYKQLKERFLIEKSNVRLAHIASDLVRINSSLHFASAARLVPNMMIECKFFCEWASVAAVKDDIETAYTLVTLQRQLVRWEHHFDAIYSDPVRRAEMGETARAWSDRLLQMSGLLTTGIPPARDLARRQSNL